MSAMINLAKQRAAMVVGDFDFTNNGQPLTALPAILTALNATYTRNSAKNVGQNGALVALSANQFGTSYDPVAGAYGYVPEPAATNLYINSGWQGSSPPTGVLETLSGTASMTYSDSAFATGAKKATCTAAAGYMFGYRNVVVSANTTYIFSVHIESVSGTFLAKTIVNCNAGLIPAGTVQSFPVCTANPTGGSTGVVQAGRLLVQYSVAGVAGTIQARFGTGCDGSAQTGTIVLSAPQAESGLRATSWILSPEASTASRSADVLTVPLWVNNAKDSENNQGAAWVNTGLTTVVSGVSDPLGGTAAFKLPESAGGTSHRAVNSGTATLVGAVYTASIYVKAAERTWCVFSIDNDSKYASFDIGNGVLGTTVVGDITRTITSAGNGWYRITITFTAGVVNASPALYIATGNATFLYSGTLNSGIYCFRLQLQFGSVATTYRPTTSTLESAANANIKGFSSAGYTLAVDQRMDTMNVSVIPIELSSLSTVDRALTYTVGGVTSTAALTANSVSQGSVSGVAIGLTRKKYAASFSLNSIMLATAGVAATPDTSATMPTGLLCLHIGAAYNGTLQYNGFIFNAKLIPTPLTQAQLNGLTT